jgi:phospholipid N-methyltransferase
VVPSSEDLSLSITKLLKEYTEKRAREEVENRPLKILEVGPGTGSFTEFIVQYMAKDDVLDLVECDESHCNTLRQKFKNDASVHCENVRVYHMSILDWNPEYEYDFIVSGLPFNVFSTDMVAQILSNYSKWIKDGGVISYFEYRWFRENVLNLVMGFLFFLEMSREYFRKEELLEHFRTKYFCEWDFVPNNFPEACVYYLRNVKQEYKDLLETLELSFISA